VQVLLGPSGALSTLRKGGILVDMTTSEPSLAVEIAAAAAAHGVSSVDAPVSGGDVGAREAKLSIMVGGEDAAVAALQPLFRCAGAAVRYGQRRVGRGAAAAGGGVCPEADEREQSGGLDIEPPFSLHRVPLCVCFAPLG
jgi:3-hydroxyisobutyrate dehydrogenase-like beta-hydroxyacid dehydrogenase